MQELLEAIERQLNALAHVLHGVVSCFDFCLQLLVLLRVLAGGNNVVNFRQENLHLRLVLVSILHALIAFIRQRPEDRIVLMLLIPTFREQLILHVLQILELLLVLGESVPQ